MGMFVKAASIGGSILVLIALVIALLKALIGFVGFISFAIKLIIILAFLLGALAAFVLSLRKRRIMAGQYEVLSPSIRISAHELANRKASLLSAKILYLGNSNSFPVSTKNSLLVIAG